jgi:REP element-mobilizing transposase RayT
MRFPWCFINEGGGTRLDHAMSRIVNRDFLFGEDEKEYSRKTMSDQVVFSGFRVLTYCIMRSHFHLLLQVFSSASKAGDSLE